MGEIYEIFRLINVCGFIWNFLTAIWRHHRGGEWHYNAFLAVVFQIAAVGGPR